MSSPPKTALVTGASSGIGLCLALEFASRGYHVFACARRLSAMESLVEQYPKQITTFAMDVTSLESMNAAYDLVVKKLEELGKDGLDVLYNNAGSSCTFPAIDVPDEALVQCMETNFIGPVRLTHVFSRLVIKCKGSLAFTGSVAGYCPFPWGSVYGASKAGIGQYASVLALEMEPFDVSVKNFITGGVKTNIADKRPLPEDSIYNIAAMREAFVERQKFAERNNPMDPLVYARKAVDEIENGWRSKVDVYLGTWSILPILVSFIPRWFILLIFRTKFHLNSVFKDLKETYKTD